MHGVLLLVLCSKKKFFRSSSIDSAPLVTSSETLPEVVDANEDTAIVAEQQVEELPAPAVVKPLQTSPDLNFASEVTSNGCDPFCLTWPKTS